MPKIEERPDVSLDELKVILFHHADQELRAYVRLKDARNRSTRTRD